MSVAGGIVAVAILCGIAYVVAASIPAPDADSRRIDGGTELQLIAQVCHQGQRPRYGPRTVRRWVTVDRWALGVGLRQVGPLLSPQFKPSP